MGTPSRKAGVNTAVVWGTLAPEQVGTVLRERPATGTEPVEFFVASLSLVLHPHNPMAPTVHANYRYFELGDADAPRRWWFGGGSDLTPAYLFDEDAAHFHRVLKSACDRHDTTYYRRFKRWCDDYFYLGHRGEHRGIGGIFFDRLHEPDWESAFGFVQDCADAFLPAYLPIAERRLGMPFGDAQKRWQQLRRGRYVEFNLLHDRGTAFGFRTGGRTESILMSLPLAARWEYDVQPQPGSAEACLLAVLREPRDWVP